MESNRSPQLTFNSEIIPKVINIRRISKFDTSYSENSYVISTTFGRSFRITESMYSIICHVDGKKNLDDLASSIKKDEDLDVNPEDLWTLFTNDLVPRGLISFQTEEKNKNEITEISLKTPFRIKIFPERSQLYLSRLLSRLTALPYLVLIIGLFLTLSLMIKIPESPNNNSSLKYIFIFLLFWIGVFIHELGHSAAGIRGGIQPGTITLRFLLFFPAFSIDVDDGWTLKRKNRIELDLGGVGLQSAYGILLMILSVIFEVPLLIEVSNITLVMVIINLMPFPGFDGYWFVSDILGIPNLRKESVSRLKNMLSKKKIENNPWGSLTRVKKAFLAFYGLFTILSFLLIIIFFQTFVYMIISMVISIPNLISQIGEAYTEGSILDFILLAINFSFIGILLLGFLLIVIRLLVTFIGFLYRIIRDFRKILFSRTISSSH